MSFTRNFLKTMSLTDEQVQAIMEEHLSVTDSLKAQRDKFEQDAKSYKEQADKVPELEKQIQGYKDVRSDIGFDGLSGVLVWLYVPGREGAL